VAIGGAEGPAVSHNQKVGHVAADLVKLLGSGAHVTLICVNAGARVVKPGIFTNEKLNSSDSHTSSKQ
jgi:hypothetical protein